MTYHWAVLDGLERLGLLGDMEREGFRLHQMCYRVLKTGEIIKLDLGAMIGHTTHPYTVVLGQDQLAEIALKKLQAHPNVQIEWSAEALTIHHDDNSVSVRTRHVDDTLTYTADWLIGTDGARSIVRKSIDVDFEGITWPEQFVATNVRIDLGAYGWDDCNYLVDDKLGAVICRITDDLWRVTFSEPSELGEDRAEERIREYYDQVLPAGVEYEKTLHSIYKMHQRVAARLRVGRVLLAGDAAHATNPTNGFGLVSGMLDSMVLSEALAAVIQGRADDTILDRYSDDRRRVFNEVATPSSSETKRLVFHSTDADRLERDLQRLRDVAADPERSRDHFRIGAGLRTPSVVPAGV